jgi:hypothetical protein
MRKLIVLGVLAALGVAFLATPASASFDHHFAVIAKAQSGRFVGDKFRFKDRLVDPENRSDKVGRDWGWCKARPNTRRLRCQGLIHLNGKIGGFGNIRVRGNIGRDDNRLNVVGGTKDFNGVAGKLLIHNQGRNGPRQRFHFDLTR